MGAAFPIAITDVADRLSISVTLMLTAVAFKYVITEQLPKVNYLTVMDYYLLEGFIMLTLLIAENAFVGIESWKPIETEKTRDQIDNMMTYIFAIVWGITHIWWMIVICSPTFMRIPWDKLDEWAKFKGQSPRIRSSVYAEEHPELAKDDSD